jgi:hypothetical protein
MYNIRRADGLWFKLPDDLKAVYLSFGNGLAVQRRGQLDLADAGTVRGRLRRHRSYGRCRSGLREPDYESSPEPQQTVDDIKALA